MKVLVILAVIVAMASAANTCATTLKTKALCNTCDERTHFWTCSTCTECASSSKACSAVCNGKGFVTEGTTKCLACPAIANCPRENITCQSTGGAVTATSAKCSQCAKGSVKFTKTNAADVCASVGIANCELEGQACTEGANNAQACDDKKKTCKTCEKGYVKFTKTGEPDVCASVGIENCELEGQACTEGANNAQACDDKKKTCKTCKPGYVKFTKTGEPDVCASVGIKNCELEGQACTEGANNAQACDDKKKACKTCKPGYVKFTKTGEPDVCASVGIENCELEGQVCTEAANNAQACDDKKKTCKTCMDGYKKVTTSGAADQCTDCTSNSGACGTGCGAAQRAVSYNDGADKCARCDALGAAYLDKCTPANCPGYYVGFGACRKLGVTAGAGTDCDDVCSDIPVYQKTTEKGTCRGCTDFTVANGKCDKGCSSTACTKATCDSGYTEASGKCTKSSGGGGSGNKTGNTTGGNTTTPTNSTGVRSVGSVLLTVSVILALIC